MYTHYPPGYAIPYGLMGKLGVYDKTFFQIFSLIVSFGSLFFLFGFVRHYTNAWVAAATVACYTLSPTFLGICDSLSGMPFNDLTRFAFLYAWTRIDQKGSWNKLTPFLIYLASLLMTLDSLLYLPAWAIYERVSRSKLKWSYFPKFAGVIFIAVSILFVQNSLYLGVLGAFKDWATTFSFHLAESNQIAFSGVAAIDKRLFGIKNTVATATGFDAALSFAVLGLMLYLGSFKVPRLTWMAGGLMLCGSTFGLVFPGKLFFVYQGIQFTPAIALVMAGFLVSLVSYLRDGFALFRWLTIVLCALGIVASLRSSYQNEMATLQTNRKIQPLIKFGQQCDKQFPGDKTIFSLRALFMLGNPKNPARYPQIYPTVEYGFNSPVLMFMNAHDLARDIVVLESKKEKPSYSIIIAPHNAALELLHALKKYEIEGQVLEELSQGDDIAVMVTTVGPPTQPDLASNTSAHPAPVLH